MSGEFEGELTLKCLSYSKVMSDYSFYTSDETNITLSLVFNADIVMLLIYKCGDLVERLTLSPRQDGVVITATQSSLILTDQKSEITIQLHQDSDTTFLLDKIYNLGSGNHRNLRYSALRKLAQVASVQDPVLSVLEGLLPPRLNPVQSQPVGLRCGL